MAQVTARKRGTTWEYRFEGVSINGKRKQYSKSGFKTKREAIAAGTDKFNLYNKTGTIFEPSEISFSDYIDYFYKQYVLQETKKNTHRNYLSVINSQLRPYFGAYKLKAINPMICQEWLNKLYDSDLKKSTVKDIKNKMSRAMEFAVHPCAFISINPMRLVHMPKKKNVPGQLQEQEKKLLSPEQFKTVLDNLTNEESRMLFILAWTLGLRLGEACGLTWDRVDFEKRTILIDRQLIGMEGGRVYVESLKTECSFRTIPFGDNLCKILLAEKERENRNKEEYGEYYCKYKTQKDNMLIPSEEDKLPFVCRRENGKCFNPKIFPATVRAISLKTGFHFTFHWLRHTNATTLLDKGLEIKEVQSRLGHADINVTYNTYIHNTQKMRDEGVALSDSFLDLSTK